MVTSITQKKKLRLKEVPSLAQGHTASKRRSWALNPFLSDLRAWALVHSAAGLPQTHGDWWGAGTKMPRDYITSARMWVDTK